MNKPSNVVYEKSGDTLFAFVTDSEKRADDNNFLAYQEFVASFDDKSIVARTDTEGRNIVHLAAKYGYFSFLNNVMQHYKKTLEKSINDADNCGFAPIHYAVELKNNCSTTLMSLRRHGANLAAVATTGETAAHLAAAIGNATALKYLFAVEKYSLDMRDLRDRSIMDCAVHGGCQEAVDMVAAHLGCPAARVSKGGIVNVETLEEKQARELAERRKVFSETENRKSVAAKEFCDVVCEDNAVAATATSSPLPSLPPASPTTRRSPATGRTAKK